MHCTVGEECYQWKIHCFHWQVVSCFAYLDHIHVFKGMFTALVMESNTLQSQITVFPIFIMPIDQVWCFPLGLSCSLASAMLVENWIWSAGWDPKERRHFILFPTVGFNSILPCMLILSLRWPLFLVLEKILSVWHSIKEKMTAKKKDNTDFFLRLMKMF